VTIGRKELAAAPTDDPSVQQVPVEIDRFDGSDLDPTVCAWPAMAPDDTLQSIAALTSRDDVIYAEPNYLRHLELLPERSVSSGNGPTPPCQNN
jgi:hypothetical protein